MKETFNLSDAAKLGLAAIVRCNHCVQRRYYRPEDLMTIFGDLPCMDVERRMRCERCGKPDYLRLCMERLTGEQMARVRFRRLLRIKTLRRPVWGD